MKTQQKLSILLLSLVPMGLFAQHGPHWWYEYGVISSDPADDYAVVNQGQLKHIAYQAYEYLNDQIPGGSGPEWVALDGLIDSWDNPGSQVDDFQAVNLGQLKHVSSLFYDVLIEEGYVLGYPWDRTAFPANDYAMVNIGQLKYIFSFDIVYPQIVELNGTWGTVLVQLSQSAAGGYYEWLIEHEVNPNQWGFDDEPASDGIPNLFKYALGMNPLDPMASWASMPEGEFIEHGEIDYFAKRFDRPIGGSPDVSYILEISYDLNVGYHDAVFPVALVEDLAEGFERVWLFDANDPDPTSNYSTYFTQLRIEWAHECDDHFEHLFDEDSNMILLGTPRFIGDVPMRACFENGLYYFPDDPNLDFIDEGFLFSTGYAARWNIDDSLNTSVSNIPGDEDFEDFLLMEGFAGAFGAANTTDASGVEIEFEVDFDDPSIETGILEVPFIFASEEYYVPDESRNDGMAIFLFELDEVGDIIPNTRTNIGLLPMSHTRSRIVSVHNAGEVQPFPGPMIHNIDESGFTKNFPEEDDDPPTPPPFGISYSGFTERLVAQGGLLRDIEISTLVQHGLDGSYNRQGGAGVFFRSKYYHQILTVGQPPTLIDTLSAYVVAFARDDETVKFVLYKLGLEADPLSNHDTSRRIDLEELGEVTVLDSVIVANYDPNAWYHINVFAEGDRIRAKYWKAGEQEGGEIDYTDENPLGSGTFGLIHTDIRSDNVAQWDEFNVTLAMDDSRDFSEYDAGELEGYDWTPLGEVEEEWTIEADGNATGGRFLRHHDDTSTVGIAMLRWNNDLGKVEQGKRYLMKIIIADEHDGRFDSALFLENRSIKVIPIEEE